MKLEPAALLRRLFDAALAAADPARCLPPCLPAPPPGKTVVLGAGKAAAAMARALEQHWPVPPDAYSGIAVTRYAHAVPCERIEVIEAAHPVPDAVSEAAARRALRMVAELSEDDLLLVLLSGGGSALLAAPAPGITLADKQAITRALLGSGAAIGEINCVRKHLSAIKGGRLAAAAWPAKTVTLAISDVAGDDPATIASGPTVADPTTSAEALAILDRYAIDIPPAVREWLRGPAAETPKAGAARLARSEYRLIATPQQALLAAAAAAQAVGVTPLILGDAIEGEAREAARVFAGMALSCARHATPLAMPCVLLSGGETTVTLGRGECRGRIGRGGRNSEFQLALALALAGHPQIHALACDTDGIDGSEDNAGAIVTPSTLARAHAAGLDAAACLAGHDAYGFFAALGDLVVTGPTLTNVNDFRALLIARQEPP